MKAIQVEVDGVVMATVGLSELAIADASIHGFLHDTEIATLNVHGWDGAASRIFLDELELIPGQSVHLRFTDCDGPFTRGATIDELYPGDPIPADHDFSITEEMAAEMRSRSCCAIASRWSSPPARSRRCRSKVSLLMTLSAYRSSGINGRQTRRGIRFVLAASRM